MPRRSLQRMKVTALIGMVTWAAADNLVYRAKLPKVKHVSKRTVFMSGDWRGERELDSIRQAQE